MGDVKVRDMLLPEEREGVDSCARARGYEHEALIALDNAIDAWRVTRALGQKVFSFWDEPDRRIRICSKALEVLARRHR